MNRTWYMAAAVAALMAMSVVPVRAQDAPRASVTPVTDATVDLIAATPVPVFVYFEADGCAPCDAMYPWIQQASRRHAARARFVRADMASSPALAERAGVTSAPALVLFAHGERTGHAHMGPLDENALTAFVDAALTHVSGPAPAARPGRRVTSAPVLNLPD